MQNFHCEELPGGSRETSMGKCSVDDAEQEQDHSEGQEEESSYDEYESDHDCSVTSGLGDRDHLQEASTPCSDIPAADATSLQADESTDTTWTDDKHSSYLDSIEATFVHKMYGKEYCSMDVCGHSSHSSIALEQDCVESHPFYLNMRKPYEQAIGLLPFRVLRRPWSSASSVVASPWIQHFKSKNGGLAKVQENGTKMEQSNLLVSKKRAALFDTPECKQSARNLHSTAAGGFKILKCPQELCHIDMAMEEQYNTEQYKAHLDQRNQDKVYVDQQNEDKIQSDSTEEEEPMPLTGVFEAGEVRKSKEVPESPRRSKQRQCAVKWV